MATLRIAWHDYNMGEDGFNIYRSDTPMDVSAMPSPIASVGPNVGAYTDSTVTGGQSYYYRIGVLRNGEELISDEQKLYAFNFALMSVSVDNIVKKTDIDGNEVWSFAGHTNNVRSIVIDSNENVYSGSQDNTVRKIDSSGNEVWSFTGNTSYVTGVAIDSNNGYVYSISSNQTVRKINSNTGDEVTTGGWPFTGHSDKISGVAVDSNNEYVYTASDDNTVKKIDPDGNEVTSGGWPFTGHSAPLSGVTVDQNTGNIYSVGSYNDRTIRKIDPNGNQIWSFSRSNPMYGQPVIDSNGYVYMGDDGGTIFKVNPANGSLVNSESWPFTAHTDGIYDISIDSEDNIYSSSKDGTARVIDSTGNEIRTYIDQIGTFPIAVYLDY